ncbi:MAG: hypothetical protein R2831_02205 [Chitinophagaceae bacterium]
MKKLIALLLITSCIVSCNFFHRTYSGRNCGKQINHHIVLSLGEFQDSLRVWNIDSNKRQMGITIFNEAFFSSNYFKAIIPNQFKNIVALVLYIDSSIYIQTNTNIPLVSILGSSVYYLDSMNHLQHRLFKKGLNGKFSLIEKESRVINGMETNYNGFIADSIFHANIFIYVMNKSVQKNYKSHSILINPK